MNFSRHLYLLCALYCYSVAVLPMANMHFNDEQGCAKGILLEALNILGITLPTYEDEPGTLKNDVFFVDQFLSRYYHRVDRDFYRRGGKPGREHEITLSQAEQLVRVLRGHHAHYRNHDPVVQKADVVICSGMSWSIKKRLHSLKEFLAAGYSCDNVFFLSRTVELEEAVKEAVAAEPELFENIQIHYLQAPYERFSHEDFVIALKNNNVAQQFYLVMDPEYAVHMHKTFAYYGQLHGLNCLGVFCRPITTDADEYVRLTHKEYKFDEFIKDEGDQIKASAYSALNILAIQLKQEIELWKNKA